MCCITFTLIRDFCVHLQAEEKAAATVEKYRSEVRNFACFLADQPLTKQIAIAYKQHCQQQGRSICSINVMVAALNAFFSFVDRADCRLKSIRLQRQVYCSGEKELSRAEYLRLLDAAKDDRALALMLQTICATGIRVSELQYITAEAVRAGEATISLKGKTRRVFLIRSLRKKLLSYLKQERISSGSVFLTRTGRPIDRVTVWRRMKRLCGRARVDERKVFPHNLRHLFARTFYDREKDLAKLADLLGHSSIDTTRIYIISSGKEHRQMMELMHLVI